jgi:hypothetical protein
LVAITALLVGRPAPASALPYCVCFTATECSNPCSFTLNIGYSRGANSGTDTLLWCNGCDTWKPVATPFGTISICGGSVNIKSPVSWCPSGAGNLTLANDCNVPIFNKSLTTKVNPSNCCCNLIQNCACHMDDFNKPGFGTPPLGISNFTFAGAGGSGHGSFEVLPAAPAPEVDADSAALPVAIVLGGMALAFGRRSIRQA